MKDDYKLAGATTTISIELEKGLVETLHKMANYTGLGISELTNTAVKRFVSGHKDFLPSETAQAPRKVS